MCYRVSSMVLALVVLTTTGAQAITIDMVPVGSVSNAADPATGYGCVNYSYNIGKYEVTAGQYTAFLNAVAKTDTYSLYRVNMAQTDNGCGITQIGSPGSYNYIVDSAFVSRPVNYVSLGDALRFANWLHNGQPTGTQALGTTENGAYSLNGVTRDADVLTVSRSADWKWTIANENEWYKAAYYDPNKAGGAGYWKYPTKSNTAPGRDMFDSSGNNANIYAGSGAYPIDSGKYTTVAGEFQNSAGPYGTFDQGGNVSEWAEVVYAGVFHPARGGTFLSGADHLLASDRGMLGPGGEFALETLGTGFRVVSAVPEPGSITLLVAAAIAGLVWWRRRKI